MPSQRFPQSEEFNCVFQLIKHQRHRSFHLLFHPFIPLFSSCTRPSSLTLSAPFLFNQHLIRLISLNLVVFPYFFLAYLLFVLEMFPTAEGSPQGWRIERLFIQGPPLGPPTSFNSSWDDVESIVISEASTHICSGCHCVEITGARILSQTQTGALSVLSFTGFLDLHVKWAKTVKLQEVCDLDINLVWIPVEKQQSLKRQMQRTVLTISDRGL